MVLSVKHKLFIGFGVVLLLIVLMSLNNFLKISNISEAEKRLLNLRMPTVMTGIQLTDGIHLSLAGLRGYMILGKDQQAAKKFKAERLHGWKIIDDSISEMEVFSKKWTDPENLNKLVKMKVLVEQFRQAQSEVENISHTAENIPAFKILLTEAAPKAKKILSAITLMINEESALSATLERKKLLKLLADSRGSFAIGLANIRAYLLSGNKTFYDAFKVKWKLNEKRFQEIKILSHLFNSKQSAAWNEYKNKRASFSVLPLKMFELRSAKDWNLANYWLGSKAAPKALAIMGILNDMRVSQEQLSLKDEEYLAEETSAMEITMILSTVVALIIGIFVSIYLANLITIPLNKVVERARLIAVGDLSGDTLIIKGNDELADLTVAINAMGNNLKDIVQNINDSSQQIGSSSEELSAITQQTSQNINEQQAQTEQVATAMNEMSTTVQEVSQNIAGTAQAAQQANIETTDGRKIVENAVCSIQNLAAELENTSEVIHQLEQDSENINAVLDVIKGVAEQTNLLALNAAIEAARAGEQGRGFAVVADEVRTLAGRTQESTEEINGVIERLQNGSRKAVEVMNKSREDAQHVVEQAKSAGHSLATISTAVERITEMSIQIASASEQQNATTEEVNRNITNIHSMSIETSSGAQQTAAASEELAQLAIGLQNIVSQFKF